MKKGACPKCKCKSVYKTENGIGRDECHHMKKGNWHGLARMASMDSYVCSKCGYFENYVKNVRDYASVEGSKIWSKVEE